MAEMAAAAVKGGVNIRELLNMDRMVLSSKQRPAASATERWLRYLGVPIGIAVFLFLYFTPLGAGLTTSGQAAAACFLFALAWWITEPVPTYFTSFVLVVMLAATDAYKTKEIMAVLGLDVIWLNVMAFILSSVLVKTRLAKRLALILVERFGAKAKWALLAFVIIQLALAPFIPATAARTVMTLPLMIVVAAIYGSTADNPTAFGKNLFLLNLAGISILSSTVMTGTTADMIAVGFIQSVGGHRVYYTDWLFANAPITITTLLLVWKFAPVLIFPMKKEEQVPQLAEGMGLIKQQKEEMGPLSTMEKKALAVFALVIFFWMTDRYHMAWFGVDIAPPIAAVIGVVAAFLPRYGVLQWSEAEVPWHLLFFSAGAYAGGMALDNTGVAEWGVRQIFGGLNLQQVPFGVTYSIIIFIMMFSHFLVTSKTIRCIIMIPLIIAMAKQIGWAPVSLALPAAFCIDWVIGTPVSAKPNVILFGTGQYSVLDNIKFSVATCSLGVVLLIIAGATWFHWLGITPGFGDLPHGK